MLFISGQENKICFQWSFPIKDVLCVFNTAFKIPSLVFVVGFSICYFVANKPIQVFLCHEMCMYSVKLICENQQNQKTQIRDIRMWFLSLDMAATASSWERNSTSASPVDFPLGATSMWTLIGFKGEKNYKIIVQMKVTNTHKSANHLMLIMHVKKVLYA